MKEEINKLDFYGGMLFGIFYGFVLASVICYIYWGLFLK